MRLHRCIEFLEHLSETTGRFVSGFELGLKALHQVQIAFVILATGFLIFRLEGLHRRRRRANPGELLNLFCKVYPEQLSEFFQILEGAMKDTLVAEGILEPPHFCKLRRVNLARRDRSILKIEHQADPASSIVPFSSTQEFLLGS